MHLLRPLIALFAAALLAAAASPADTLDEVARDYVRMGLEIGVRDPGFVDAYYGPAEWRQAADAAPRTLEELAAAAAALKARIERIPPASGRLEQRRRAFLLAQIGAASTRLRMVRGERLSFVEEARGLYGVSLEGRLHPLSHYDPIIARIDRLLPGEGPLRTRAAAFTGRFVIPPERLDAVMRAAIGECRRRTLAQIPLPDDEAFTLEFVTGQPWSGYNWYQGQYRSLIQINTDFPTMIGRALDLGCHEGYPGHHAYNMLLERELARDRGWSEYLIYPLYSPQSFIAEGSANYGIELAFPGPERLEFETRVLYPLAGLPVADAAAYLALEAAIDELQGARFTIARDYLDGRIGREEALALIERYQLVARPQAEQSLAFTDRYRAYVINYGLGLDMVRAYVERSGDAPAARWATMRRLLSEPTLPADLAAPAP
jgi:hypothetical protein